MQAKLKLVNDLNVFGGWAFWSLLDLKRDCSTNLELIKGNTYKVVGVEEKIFVLSFAGNKSKAFVCLGFDCTCHINFDGYFRIIVNPSVTGYILSPLGLFCVIYSCHTFSNTF